MAANDEVPVDEQAAAWLARLHSRAVTTDELADFAAWRRLPSNAKAYERAERLWQESDRLASDPHILSALRGARTPSQPRRATIPLALLGGIAAALLIVFANDVTSRHGQGPDLRTLVGQRSRTALEDGSVVELDTNSEVAINFDERERRFELRRGQAFFNVEHDAARPFVVSTGDGVTVTALGTRFDVRLTSESTRVGLIQGSVVVARDGHTIAVLRPGETIAVPGDGSATPVPASIDAIGGWREGRLSFAGTPLHVALAEINRYTSKPLVLARPEAKDELISGVFSVDDPDGFTQAVNALLGRSTISRSDPAAP